MNPEQYVDSILAQEETIVPSSGFVGSVMQTIQRESEAAAPLPFPWKCALPGFVASALVIAFVLATFRHAGPKANAGVDMSPALVQTINALVDGMMRADSGLVILVLLGSLTAVKLALFVFAAKR